MRSTMAYVAATLISLWLIVVVPGWIFAMLYARTFLLLPDGRADTQSWLFAAAFYVPPIVSAAIALWLSKSKNQSTNA